MTDLHESNDPKYTAQIDTAGWIFVVFAVAITVIAAVVAYHGIGTMIASPPVFARRGIARLGSGTAATATAAWRYSPRSATPSLQPRRNVRYPPESLHRQAQLVCPLSATSRHSVPRQGRVIRSPRRQSQVA
jgi:hypothetical protein